MADYRCYLLDHRGHIRGVEVLEAHTDDEAKTAALLVHAKRRNEHPAIEVWQRGRKVFAHPPEGAAATVA